MSKYGDRLIKCAEPECEHTIKSHAWSVIKNDGWFHQWSGNSWCPDHHPEWVAEWRAKKEAQAKKEKNG